MEILNVILTSTIVTTIIGGGVWMVLKTYITEKLKGEINKDLERYKGDISKDVEKYKGAINKDIEIFKADKVKLNLEISKYIETITVQRIKWLENMREDISTLTGLLEIYFKLQEAKKVHYLNYRFYEKNLIEQIIDEDEKKKKFEELCDKENEGKKIIEEKFKNFSELKCEIISICDIIRLRLNPNEDNEFLELLRKIKSTVISHETENENKSLRDLSEKVIENAQQLLKKEWEKVKNEVKS